MYDTSHNAMNNVTGDFFFNGCILQDAELPSLLERTGEDHWQHFATPAAQVTQLGSAQARPNDSDPFFLLYSRKDLAEQTVSGPQGEDSFQLHVGAAHLLALGHSSDSLCEGANWNTSRILGGSAKSAHWI